MRRLPWLIMAATICLIPASGWPAQQGQTAPPPSAKADASQPPAPVPAPQTDSLADAARKAREKQKAAPKSPKVFTNDNLPTEGGISSVGQAATDKSSDDSAGTSGTATGSASPSGEKAWRYRFAALRHKLDQDQSELDVDQRELGELATQFYGGDPNAAFQDQQGQQVGGAAQSKKMSDIDAKKKQVQSDQQAIDDAEDELRKSGGDPGWAR
jgi:hypothetical protein